MHKCRMSKLDIWPLCLCDFLESRFCGHSTFVLHTINICMYKSQLNSPRNTTTDQLQIPRQLSPHQGHLPCNKYLASYHHHTEVIYHATNTSPAITTPRSFTMLPVYAGQDGNDSQHGICLWSAVSELSCWLPVQL